MQNIQKLMGGNPMIKNVLSNPEHMAMAQKMLKNPETQKQIGGIYTKLSRLVFKKKTKHAKQTQHVIQTQCGNAKKKNAKQTKTKM